MTAPLQMSRLKMEMHNENVLEMQYSAMSPICLIAAFRQAQSVGNQKTCAYIATLLLAECNLSVS